jgi:hypothetical protein
MSPGIALAAAAAAAAVVLRFFSVQWRYMSAILMKGTVP